MNMGAFLPSVVLLLGVLSAHGAEDRMPIHYAHEAPPTTSPEAPSVASEANEETVTHEVASFVTDLVQSHEGAATTPAAGEFTEAVGLLAGDELAQHHKDLAWALGEGRKDVGEKRRKLISKTFLVEKDGFDYYQVQVNGAMTRDNIVSTCAAAGMSAPCPGTPGSCSWVNQNTQCLDTGFTGCGWPMKDLAVPLGCGSDNWAIKTCAPIANTYIYMDGWSSNSGCGTNGVNSWCISGSSVSNLYALCVDNANEEKVVTANGYDFYKVPVTGAMTNANIMSACKSKGMLAPCPGKPGQCSYGNGGECFDAGFTGCGWPMKDLAVPLGCGSDNWAIKNCKALTNTFIYMYNWQSHSGCGTSGSGSWCMTGYNNNNMLALCVDVKENEAKKLTTWGGYDFYQVGLSGAATSANILSACKALNLDAPCPGKPNACSYGNGGECFDAGLVGCGNPMNDLTSTLGCSSISTCKPLTNTFIYMYGWQNPHAGCGTSGSGSWCLNGNSYSGMDALCVDKGKGTFLVTYAGYDYYKVPMAKTISTLNIAQTCLEFGMQAPCPGDPYSCSSYAGNTYGGPNCLDTGFTGCGWPMKDLALVPQWRKLLHWVRLVCRRRDFTFPSTSLPFPTTSLPLPTTSLPSPPPLIVDLGNDITVTFTGDVDTTCLTFQKPGSQYGNDPYLLRIESPFSQEVDLVDDLFTACGFSVGTFMVTGEVLFRDNSDVYRFEETVTVNPAPPPPPPPPPSPSPPPPPTLAGESDAADGSITIKDFGSEQRVTGVHLIPNKMKKKLNKVEVYTCRSDNIQDCFYEKRIQKCRLRGKAKSTKDGREDAYVCDFVKGAVSAQYWLVYAQPNVHSEIEFVNAGDEDELDSQESAGISGGCSDKLPLGKMLEAGEYIEHGKAKATMQHDGNFVLFHDGKPVWSTKTTGDDFVATVKKSEHGVVFAIVDPEDATNRWSSYGAGPQAIGEANVDDSIPQIKDESHEAKRGHTDGKQTHEEEEEEGGSSNNHIAHHEEEESEGGTRHLLSVEDSYLSVDSMGTLALYSGSSSTPIWKAATAAFDAGEGCPSAEVAAAGSVYSYGITSLVGSIMAVGVVVVVALVVQRRRRSVKLDQGYGVVFDESI
ncbi:hypothetical protein CYMTET_45731 [Cymbomonas tetramitiformis]|uniref:Uncharacterized protein n=1 Tax=Cymbomonas tetramitiformis TaxID=36881 RepID=A0AAE0BZD8_9CHLO|nr:hypothetical protein CYMTET_45731 [Cymbomonas tetramitiformis]